MDTRLETDEPIEGAADGIAISQEDFDKYGCINEGCCNYGHPADMSRFSEKVASNVAKLLECRDCRKYIITLAAGVTISPICHGGKSCHRLSSHPAKKSVESANT